MFLDSIIYEEKKDLLRFSLEKAWIDEEILRKNVEKFADVQLKESENQWIIEINSDKAKKVALEFANAINGLNFKNKNIKKKEKVELSCIILVSANIDFVKERLIPSIIDNTKVNLEIIIVYNGKDKIPDLREDIKTVESNYLYISKGYNKGVKEAKGEYIAIFHDDCILLDSEWFEKCKKGLDGDIIAVSPELDEDMPFKLIRMKFVPLVMRKKDFRAIDEHYFFGKEELDCSYSILARGKKFKRVDINYSHIRAISTILNFSGREDLSFYFSLCLVPKEVIYSWTKYYLDRFMFITDGLINIDNEVYFYEKFSDHLSKIRGKEMIKGYVEVLKGKIEHSDNEIYDMYRKDMKKFVSWLKGLRIS